MSFRGKNAVFSLSRQASPVLPAVHLSQPHRHLRLQGGDSSSSLISQRRTGDDPLFRECRIWGQDGGVSPIRFLFISRNKIEGWDFQNGRVRSSAEISDKQQFGEILVSENCPKSIPQVKKHSFKKIY